MTAPPLPRNIGAGDCSTAPELWDRICSTFIRHRRLFLFANFDGTLAQLVDVPSQAALDAQVATALRRLCKRPRVSVAVLSGRGVDDLAGRIGLPISYAGDHGLEIHAPDLEFAVPEADELRRKLPEVCNRIRQEILHIPGALVEAKRLTASVHFRQVPPEQVADVRQAVQKCIQGTAFEMHGGNCAFEIRPQLAWSKGDAVLWLLNRSHAAPEQAVCIGDDDTDEDLFHRVPGAINIRVTDCGAVNTVAPYYVCRDSIADVLNGVAEVAEATC